MNSIILETISSQSNIKLPGIPQQELTLKQKLDVREMDMQDRSIRQHEMTHMRAARDLALGSPDFQLETGPDGKQYAVHGHVEINSGTVQGDPQATIEKALKIQRTATAPSDPSPKDLQAATRARIIESKAHRQLARQEATDARVNQKNAEDSANLNLPPGSNAYKTAMDYEKNLFTILDLFA